MNKSPEEYKEDIKFNQLALELTVSALNPNLYGATVNVKLSGVKDRILNIPELTFEGQHIPIAKVSGADFDKKNQQLKFNGEFTVVKIDFTALGFCRFAKTKDGSFGDTEIQLAVDTVLNSYNK